MRERAPHDDAALAALLLRVHAADGYPLHATPEQALAFMASGDRLAAWVAEQDGAVVGHVCLLDAPGYATVEAATAATGLNGLVLVARLFVDPAVQRSGVGRALLRQAVDAARERGLRAVLDVGQVFTKAVALYEAEGWQRVGELHEPHDGVVLDLWVYLSPPAPADSGPSAGSRSATS